jgi:tryptophan synthase alpha chain
MFKDEVLLKSSGKSIGLMTHIIVGYPSLEANWQLLEAMDEAGVEIVEMQFPFSEPIADGHLFMRANQYALDQGIRLQDCLDLMQKAAKQFSFKILMMGYYNTVFKQGEEHFCQLLSDAGGSGMIVPDLPLEESAHLNKCAVAKGLFLTPLAAPTNKPERLQEICDYANQHSQLLYAVARKGVTGSHTEFGEESLRYLHSLKSMLKVPLAVGFGLQSRADIEPLLGTVDFAVVGSAMLRAYEQGGAAQVRDLLAHLR